jgi:hypothetical protein
VDCDREKIGVVDVVGDVKRAEERENVEVAQEKGCSAGETSRPRRKTAARS